MEKREITLKIGETNEQAGRRAYKSEQLARKIKKIKVLFATAGLAAGLVGGPIITSIAQRANHTADTREAIQLAADSEAYLKNIKENPIMNQVVEQANLEQLSQLNDAIVTYKNLNSKADRSFNEEATYMQACNTIKDSKELVTENYHDVIRKKIAEAFNITDPAQIRNLSVYYDEDFSGGLLTEMVEIHGLPYGEKDKYLKGIRTEALIVN